MNGYTGWVTENPLLSAAAQFALLGTLGELVSHVVRQKRSWGSLTLAQTLWKTLAWGVLGVVIKYGFTGMKGFTQALIDHHLLPSLMGGGVGRAFAVSVLTNVFFGPQMMYFHRLEDNLIMGEWQFAGMSRALWTLLWFWIPAHTVTFSLSAEYQIGLAALWSLVLGLLLGLAKGKR